MIALIDVDNFKRINDRYGHGAGDRALKKVSEIMSACVSAQDTVARYGGDEFCIMLCNTSKAQAAALFERMRALAQPEVGVNDGEPMPTLSIGAAMYCPHAGTRALWIHHADEAMYLAKKAGRNRVVFADGLTVR